MAYRNYATANGHIVDNSGNGDYTTIQAAITAASSGQTIFIRPKSDGSAYSENLTLKAGVSLSAFGCDSSLNATGNVIISGKATFTAAGSVTISGIQLQTNSDFFLAVTGSAASNVNLLNCYLNCLNNTGISFTSSSASANIRIQNCWGNLATTGIGLWSSSSAGNIQLLTSQIDNTGNSTTATSNSAGGVTIDLVNVSIPFSTTSTGGMTGQNSNIACAGTNTTAMTINGTGTSSFINCGFQSGTASGVSIGGGASSTLSLCRVDSSNTNAVSGSGTLVNAGISFTGSSYKINTSSVTAANFDVGGISFDGGTNVLSAYAQGTFSPTYQTTNGDATGITYSIQTGTYTRIGNIVFVYVFMTWSNTGAGTGSACLNNLPFTVKNLANYYPTGPLAIQNILFTAPYLQCAAITNTTQVFFNTVNSASSTGNLGAGVYTNASVGFSITYQI